jgi:hypothetical protein
MLEELKEIAVGDMLTIDNADVLEMTDAEDFTVLGVKVYTQDEGDVIIIDLETHCLIAHTLGGEPRYYVVEKAASGSPDELEDDGFRLVLKDDSMPSKFYSGRNGGEILYKAKHGPVYGMNVERDDVPPEEEASEIAVCEYRGKTKSKPLSVVMLERLDEHYALYQGLQISEASIIL